MYSLVDVLSSSRSKVRFCLLRFANDLEEYAKVEQMPVLEGKRMILFIAPKKVAAPEKRTAESTAARSHRESSAGKA